MILRHYQIAILFEVFTLSCQTNLENGHQKPNPLIEKLLSNVEIDDIILPIPNEKHQNFEINERKPRYSSVSVKKPKSLYELIKDPRLINDVLENGEYSTNNAEYKSKKFEISKNDRASKNVYESGLSVLKKYKPKLALKALEEINRRMCSFPSANPNATCKDNCLSKCKQKNKHGSGLGIYYNLREGLLSSPKSGKQPKPDLVTIMKNILSIGMSNSKNERTNLQNSDKRNKINYSAKKELKETPYIIEKTFSPNKYNGRDNNELLRCGCSRNDDESLRCGCSRNDNEALRCGCSRNDDKALRCGCSRNDDKALRCGCSRNHDESLRCGCSRSDDQNSNLKSDSDSEPLRCGCNRNDDEALRCGCSRNDDKALRCGCSRNDDKALRCGCNRDDDESLRCGCSRNDDKALRCGCSRSDDENSNFKSGSDSEPLRCGCSRNDDEALRCGCSRNDDKALRCGCSRNDDKALRCGCSRNDDKALRCGCSRNHDESLRCGCSRSDDQNSNLKSDSDPEPLRCGCNRNDEALRCGCSRNDDKALRCGCSRNDDKALRCGCNRDDDESLRCGCSRNDDKALRCGCSRNDDKALRCGCNRDDDKALRCGCSRNDDKALRCGCSRNDDKALRCGCNRDDDESLRCGCSRNDDKALRCGCSRNDDKALRCGCNRDDDESLRCGCSRNDDKALRCGCSRNDDKALRCGCSRYERFDDTRCERDRGGVCKRSYYSSLRNHYLIDDIVDYIKAVNAKHKYNLKELKLPVPTYLSKMQIAVTHKLAKKYRNSNFNETMLKKYIKKIVLSGSSYNYLPERTINIDSSCCDCENLKNFKECDNDDIKIKTNHDKGTRETDIQDITEYLTKDQSDNNKHVKNINSQELILLKKLTQQNSKMPRVTPSTANENSRYCDADTDRSRYDYGKDILTLGCHCSGVDSRPIRLARNVRRDFNDVMEYIIGLVGQKKYNLDHVKLGKPLNLSRQQLKEVHRLADQYHEGKIKKEAELKKKVRLVLKSRDSNYNANEDSNIEKMVKYTKELILFEQQNSKKGRKLQPIKAPSFLKREHIEELKRLAQNLINSKKSDGYIRNQVRSIYHKHQALLRKSVEDEKNTRNDEIYRSLAAVVSLLSSVHNEKQLEFVKPSFYDDEKIQYLWPLVDNLPHHRSKHEKKYGNSIVNILNKGNMLQKIPNNKHSGMDENFSEDHKHGLTTHQTKHLFKSLFKMSDTKTKLFDNLKVSENNNRDQSDEQSHKYRKHTANNTYEHQDYNEIRQELIDDIVDYIMAKGIGGDISFISQEQLANVHGLMNYLAAGKIKNKAELTDRVDQILFGKVNPFENDNKYFTCSGRGRRYYPTKSTCDEIDEQPRCGCQAKCSSCGRGVDDKDRKVTCGCSYGKKYEDGDAVGEGHPKKCSSYNAPTSNSDSINYFRRQSNDDQVDEVVDYVRALAYNKKLNLGEKIIRPKHLNARESKTLERLANQLTDKDLKKKELDARVRGLLKRLGKLRAAPKASEKMIEITVKFLKKLITSLSEEKVKTPDFLGENQIDALKKISSKLKKKKTMPSDDKLKKKVNSVLKSNGFIAIDGTYDDENNSDNHRPTAASKDPLLLKQIKDVLEYIKKLSVSNKTEWSKIEAPSFLSYSKKIIAFGIAMTVQAENISEAEIIDKVQELLGESEIVTLNDGKKTKPKPKGRPKIDCALGGGTFDDDDAYLRSQIDESFRCGNCGNDYHIGCGCNKNSRMCGCHKKCKDDHNDQPVLDLDKVISEDSPSKSSISEVIYLEDILHKTRPVLSESGEQTKYEKIPTTDHLSKVHDVWDKRGTVLLDLDEILKKNKVKENSPLDGSNDNDHILDKTGALPEIYNVIDKTGTVLLDLDEIQNNNNLNKNNPFDGSNVNNILDKTNTVLLDFDKIQNKNYRSLKQKPKRMTKQQKKRLNPETPVILRTNNGQLWRTFGLIKG